MNKQPGDETDIIIRKAGEEWARYWNERQADKLAELYAEDAVYLPPHHAAVHGRGAIRKYLETPLAHGYTNLKFDVTYIRQTGDLAYDVGNYTMNLPDPGSRREDRGKYLTVWRRRGDGWHIMADAWSSDLPAEK
jgi:uncharacterized protein (TIGR02246 family)